jgi:hypothetical protein
VANADGSRSNQNLVVRDVGNRELIDFSFTF